MRWLGAYAPNVLPAPAVGKLEVLWMRLGLRGQIAVSLVAAAVVIWIIYRIWVRLGRAGRRGVLWGGIGFLAFSFAILLTWTLRLPPPKGSVFILWHQIVRIGAVLSGTLLLITGLLALLPKTLNLVERRGFLSFVAARHVRAHKSGFLTVISTLSIGGVALSCASL